VFYFLFGWLMAGTFRATRAGGVQRGPAEAEKQRCLMPPVKVRAKQARKAANRAMWKEHPGQVLLTWESSSSSRSDHHMFDASNRRRHDPAVPVPDTTYNTVPAPHPPTRTCVFGAPPVRAGRVCGLVSERRHHRTISGTFSSSSAIAAGTDLRLLDRKRTKKKATT